MTAGTGCSAPARHGLAAPLGSMRAQLPRAPLPPSAPGLRSPLRRSTRSHSLWLARGSITRTHVQAHARAHADVRTLGLAWLGLAWLGLAWRSTAAERQQARQSAVVCVHTRVLVACCRRATSQRRARPSSPSWRTRHRRHPPRMGLPRGPRRRKARRSHPGFPIASPHVTSAQGLGSPLRRLHGDWAHPMPRLHGDWACPMPRLHADWAHPMPRLIGD